MNSLRLYQCAMSTSRIEADRSLLPNQKPSAYVTDAKVVIVDGTWHHTNNVPVRHSGLAPLALLSARSQRAQPLPHSSRAECCISVDSRSGRRRAACPGAGDPWSGSTPGGFRLHDRAPVGQFPRPWAAGAATPRSPRTYRNVPLALVGDPDRIVVAYGESAPCAGRGQTWPRAMPVYWAAQRLGTGERFAWCARAARSAPSCASLGHLELTQDDFAQGAFAG